MSFGTRLLNEPVRSAASPLSVGYAAVGNPLAFQARIMLFQNFTNAPVMVSLDGGATDAFPLNSNSSFVLDISSDAVGQYGLFVSKGTQISVKYISLPSSGSFYVSSLYAYGDNN